jgi:flagellar biosynthesis/type III secretory pathway chaperone
MSFDERLERIAERHEALAQAVEIVAGMQQKNETLLTHVIESIDSLARIAHMHEQRLSHLEDGQN